jgi:hypothetical protein
MIDGSNAEVNVQQIMATIRHRVRQIRRRDEDATRRARRAISNELLSRVSRFNARVGTLRANVNRIGEMPPQPPTLRGRMGALLVRLMQRALFWLIPSLQAIEDQVAQALEDQAKINEEFLKALQEAHIKIEQLQDAPAQPNANTRADS